MDVSIQAFKEDLAKFTNEQVINKYYHSGSAFAIDENQYHALRERVCAQFNVEFTEVFLVGSAKLGFSIKQKRRFCQFTDTSDIDVVILSSRLFEKIWKEVLTFEDTGGYWPQITSFKDYHFTGWMRPDKLPLERSFNLTKEWWDFFEALSGSGDFGPFKVRGGLYHSKYFLEKYQSKCFEQCRAEIS